MKDEVCMQAQGASSAMKKKGPPGFISAVNPSLTPMRGNHFIITNLPLGDAMMLSSRHFYAVTDSNHVDEVMFPVSKG